MEFDIPIAGSYETIEINDKNIQQIVYPNKVDKKDESELLRMAFNDPINSISFFDLIENSDKLLIVVNDIYRSTPTYKIIDHIYHYIKDIYFDLIVATGSHREPTEIEKEKIFGSNFYSKFRDRIIVHNSKDENQIYLGKSKFGTEIYINKIIFNYQYLITINSIEPHYFAGYTGGRKSIVPGLAGNKTITQNHYLALKKDAGLTKLVGNPVNEDLEDIVKRINRKLKFFSINFVTDFDNDIYACATGNIFDTFYKLIKYANEIHSVKIKNKADIVVTVTKPPLDKNLYQSQKALEAAKAIVKPNGIIILVTGSIEGIGPSNYYDLLKTSKDPEVILKKIKKEYKLGYHKTAKLLDASSMSSIFIVSKLNPKLFDGTFIKPYSSINEAIKIALNEKGNNSKVLFLMDGALISPIT